MTCSNRRSGVLGDQVSASRACSETGRRLREHVPVAGRRFGRRFRWQAAASGACSKSWKQAGGSARVALRLGSPDVAITESAVLKRLLEAGFDPNELFDAASERYWKTAVRTTARSAAFIPGASPPLVITPIRFILPLPRSRSLRSPAHVGPAGSKAPPSPHTRGCVRAIPPKPQPHPPPAAREFEGDLILLNRRQGFGLADRLHRIFLFDR